MFPGARTDPDDARYVIIGAPFDATTSFLPGARFGPGRIRKFAHALEGYDRRTDQDVSELGVGDVGDVEAGADPASVVEYLQSTLTGHVLNERVPILLGGEHTVSVAGVRATEPDVFVSIDAHLDLRDRYRGQHYSHATVTRRALETVEEAVIVGARSGSRAEWERTTSADVTLIAPEEAASWVATYDAPIYLSVDIDAIDPAYAPATGTPAPYGLEPAIARDIIATLAPTAVGFDVVEVTDRDAGQTATLAASLVRRFICDHAQAHG